MNYKKDLRPYLNFVLKYRSHDKNSFVVGFYTPEDCSCGHPHGSLLIQTSDDNLIQLCSFSMNTKKSFGNFVSCIESLFGMDVFEDIIKNVMSQKKSLVDSE
jgi:hypothetical protein